jgi:hypothetical protein
VRGLRAKMNTTSSKSTRVPPATTHHRVDVCPVVPEVVEVGAVACFPGDGELAVKENVPLTV